MTRDVRPWAGLRSVLATVLLASSAFAVDDNPAAVPSHVALPTPTRPHPVGTTILLLTDSSRQNPFPSESPGPRELTVQVWYPARASRSAPRQPYVPSASLLEAMKAEGYMNLPPELLDGWVGIKTHCLRDAAILPSETDYPLLVFSPGFGVSRINYTTILAELASHGYVVAGIDHPYEGISVTADGRVLSSASHARHDPDAVAERIQRMVEDAVFVVDQLLNPASDVGRLAARIDPGRTGMFGHSLGGAAALEACRSQPRFKACANLDGDPWGSVETEGVARPYLVVLNVPIESKRPPAKMRAERDAQWATIASRQSTVGFIAKISDTCHLSFSDFPFLVPADRMERNGATLSPERGLAIMIQLLRSFFEMQFADGSEDVALRSAAEANPEIHSIQRVGG